MNVKYTDEIMGTTPGTMDLKDLVKGIIEDSTFSEGRIEGIDNKVDKITEMMGRLIDTLAEKKILDSKDINTILQNYKYSGYRLLYQVKINYVVGDATEPKGEGKKIIAHVCNDEGKWGAGFVLALSEKWDRPEEEYKDPIADLALGDAQFVQVEDDIWVANMVAQKGIRSVGGRPPIRYDALQEALIKVAEFAVEMNASVHAPRFGAGLAGGKWEKIEYLIQDTLIREGVPVFIYDLPDKPQRAD